MGQTHSILEYRPRGGGERRATSGGSLGHTCHLRVHSVYGLWSLVTVASFARPSCRLAGVTNFYHLTNILRRVALLPFYAKSGSLLPNPHPMTFYELYTHTAMHTALFEYGRVNESRTLCVFTCLPTRRPLSSLLEPTLTRCAARRRGPPARARSAGPRRGHQACPASAGR